MENFNRLLALFAALFITIIGGFLIVKRFDLQTKYPIFGGGASQLTPTVMISPTQKNAQAIKQKFTQTTAKKNKTGAIIKNVSSIPETGIPPVLLPISLGILAVGLRLRKAL